MLEWMGIDRVIAMTSVTHRLHARSVAMLGSLEQRLPQIMTWWLVFALLASAVRIGTSPLPVRGPSLGTIIPYMLLTCAPLVSMGLALRWFVGGDRFAQPVMRLARIGKWRSVSLGQARRHRLYGTTGFMVSLMIGMLINVPVRAAEYLAAMPALAGPVPHWLHALHAMMTLDVVLLSSLYVVAFAAALRRVPFFPRLLAAIWAIDLAMQFGIADVVTRTEGLPQAVATSLHTILDGNVKKVLISVVIWAPYLLMSKRVNVTFRQRIAA